MNDGVLDKRKVYLAVGGIGVLLAAGYLGLALEVPFGRLDQPGPGTFPVLAGIVLLVASLITLWEGWRLNDGSRIELPSGADTRRVVGFIVLLLGFLIAMPILGYPISSLLFCILLMRLLSDQSWPSIMTCALVMCAALYGVFIAFLKVPMPRGILLGY